MNEFAFAAAALAGAAAILALALPRINLVRSLRRLIRDYGFFTGTPGEEREHWLAVARRHFERLGWKEGRIVSRLGMIRQAHEAMMEREDIRLTARGRAREFARRVLICQLVKRDEILPVRETERIYLLVEIETRRFEREKGGSHD